MRAHTVILGAGATVAAIPNGDKYGKESSVMNGLIEKLHLVDLLDGISLKTSSDNLEDIYSELYERPDCQAVVKALEDRIYDYFDSLELPDEPTVYDLLILSLTKKDAIATFNWDPLLLQAYVRCHRITSNLPAIFCLHGNVAMGVCLAHKEFGTKDARCPVCRKLLPPIKLLYPVKKKDYNSDWYIKNCWDAVEYMIENSYMLTIFGYSAPSSDFEAINLLKKAWGGLESRQLEEVSIIDIISREEVVDKWSDFIYSHHYRHTDNFFRSYLGMFPRRSCEMVFSTVQLNLTPDVNGGFYEGMSWEDVRSLLSSLLIEELETTQGRNLPPHYLKAGQFK